MDTWRIWKWRAYLDGDTWSVFSCSIFWGWYVDIQVVLTYHLQLGLATLLLSNCKVRHHMITLTYHVSSGCNREVNHLQLLSIMSQDCHLQLPAVFPTDFTGWKLAVKFSNSDHVIMGHSKYCKCVLIASHNHSHVTERVLWQPQLQQPVLSWFFWCHCNYSHWIWWVRTTCIRRGCKAYRRITISILPDWIIAFSGNLQKCLPGNLICQ